MDDRRDCSRKRPPTPPADCFFRHTSLLQVPQSWRGALRHLGEALDDVTLEIYGLVPEAPDSLATTVERLRAIADDLATSARQLEELAAEPEASELVEAEVALCRLAGRWAPKVKELVKEVLRRLAAVC